MVNKCTIIGKSFRTSYDKYKCRCEDCRTYIRERSYKWIAKNPEKHKTNQRKYYLNNILRFRNSRKINKLFSNIEYDRLFQEQGGVCKVCSNPPGKRRLAVDHNHTTGKIRGLLCSNCNTSLGLLKENKEILYSMCNYIDLYNGGK